LETDGRVAEADCVVQERTITKERVVVAGVSPLLTHGSRLRRKRKAGKGESDEKKTAYNPDSLDTRYIAPQRRPAD